MQEHRRDEVTDRLEWRREEHTGCVDEATLPGETIHKYPYRPDPLPAEEPTDDGDSAPEGSSGITVV